MFVNDNHDYNENNENIIIINVSITFRLNYLLTILDLTNIYVSW